MSQTIPLPTVCKDKNFAHYIIDELYQMVADGEKQIAEGRWYSTEEVIRMCRDEIYEEK